MKRYKFLREKDGKIKSESGNTEWKLSEWQKHEGKLGLCKSGFHCSKKIRDAISYVQGGVLAEVEVKGKHIEKDDKEAWQGMRLVKVWKWQKKDSVAIAIYCAELVIDIFEKKYPKDDRPRKAIEAAKAWLKDPTEENRIAAYAASAANAAYAVANAAYAATAAANAAANAAYAASAASVAIAAIVATAAKKSIIKKIYKRFDDQLKVLEEYHELTKEV